MSNLMNSAEDFLRALMLSAPVAILLNGAAIAQEFKEIAKGADKRVLVKSGDPDHVYYFPVKKLGGLINKTSALKDELNTVEKINDLRQQKGLSPAKHLAVDMIDVSTPEQKKKGEIVLRAPKAVGDLESVIRNGKMTPAQRIDVAHQVLKAGVEAQQIGLVAGDLKPENFLVFHEKDKNGKIVLDQNGDPKLVVKRADFGKDEFLPKGASKQFKGNLRLGVGPEGTLSEAGEVAATANVMRRVLEEGVLDQAGTPLVATDKKNKEAKAISKRRGFEKFVVENDAFLGIDEDTLAKKATKSGPRRIKLGVIGRSGEAIKRQVELTNQYDDVLVKKLVQKNPELAGEFEQLGNLLKDMSKADPKQRTTLQEADKRVAEVKAKAINQANKLSPAKSAASQARNELVKATNEYINAREKLKDTKNLPDQEIDKLRSRLVSAEKEVADSNLKLKQVTSSFDKSPSAQSDLNRAKQLVQKTDEKLNMGKVLRPRAMSENDSGISNLNNTPKPSPTIANGNAGADSQKPSGLRVGVKSSVKQRLSQQIHSTPTPGTIISPNLPAAPGTKVRPRTVAGLTGAKSSLTLSPISSRTSTMFKPKTVPKAPSAKPSRPLSAPSFKIGQKRSVRGR